MVAQRDSPPRGGLAPTTLWLPGDAILDDYAIDLPASLPAGDYRVEVGLYDPATGERLPADVPSGRPADAIVLDRPLAVASGSP